MRYKYLTGFAVFFFLAFLFLTNKKTIPEIDVYVVKRGCVEKIVTNSRAGMVEANKRSKISTEISGKLLKLHVKEGDRVKKGDLLFEMDAEALLLEEKSRLALLNMTRARLQEASANLKKAAGDLKRSQKLIASEQVSLEELESHQVHYEASLAAREAAVSEVKDAEVLLASATLSCRKCRVRAPFSGIISERFRYVGEWIIAGEAVLEVVDVADLKVLFDIDEIDIGLLQEGLRVRVLFDPWKNQFFSGKVVRLSPALLTEEKQNRTLEIEVRLDAYDTQKYRLIPGLSADVEVIIEKMENALRIPRHALFEDDQVYLVEEGVLHVKKVTTGLKNWRFVEVLAGIKEGDRLALSIDRDKNIPGEKVKPREVFITE
jgi:HlyD family secretion protein